MSDAKWLSGSSARDGLRDLLSGMVSGFVCKIVEYPADTIKVLEQTGGNRFSGPIDCFFKTVTESGALSLYRGLTAPLLGSMAECASLFTSYGYAKKVLGVNEEAATPSNPVPFWKLVVSGAGSGFASSCVLTPVELVKCRLQAQLNCPSGSTDYKGPIDCIVRTVREEGVTGLWRGNLKPWHVRFQAIWLGLVSTRLGCGLFNKLGEMRGKRMSRSTGLRCPDLQLGLPTGRFRFPQTQSNPRFRPIVDSKANHSFLSSRQL